MVLYLDSYGNRDPRKNGESADGFAVKSGSGNGNVLRGARIWNNVDDGIDLWYAYLLCLNRTLNLTPYLGNLPRL